MLLCAVAVLAAPAASISAHAATITPDVETCTDIVEWAFKIVDGKLYKALFNRSTGQYLTDWEYVCDWPPEE